MTIITSTKLKPRDPRLLPVNFDLISAPPLLALLKLMLSENLSCIPRKESKFHATGKKPLTD
jgi:hypothetical protein